MRAPLLSLALAFAAACSPFAGYDAADAATELPLPGDAGEGDGCQPVRAPERPASSAQQGTTQFVVAHSVHELGDADYEGEAITAAVGYDLDGACTESSSVTTCVRPDWATGDHTDYPGGRDNAFGRVLYQLYRMNKSNPDFVRATEVLNRRAADGTITTVIRVRGYNDAADDDRVGVDVFAGTLRAEDGELGQPPAWDGHDAWHPLAPWLEPAPDGSGDLGGGRFRARYSAEDAFVSDWMLVARFDELRVGTGVLAHVVLTAEIDRDVRGPWVLREGTIAGRHDADDLLATLEAPLAPGAGPGCVGSEDYEAAKAFLCSFADINFGGTDDGSAPCDALSWAWHFQSEPAALSDEVRPELLLTDTEREPCPEGTSPAHDHCGATRTAP